MSWHVVARKDFTDASRSRLLWVNGAVLVGLILLVAALEAPLSGVGPSEFVALLGVPLLVIVPIAALIASYQSIVGERQTGSLKLLLGLSLSRSDVVVGTFVGRSAVITAGVGAAFATAVGCSLVLFRTVAVLDMLALAALTVAFALSFVGVAVGLSSVLPTRRGAMAAAVACYLAFVFFWELLVTGVSYLVVGSLPGQQVEPWFLFLERLGPVAAYEVAASAAFEGQLTHFASISVRPEAASAPLTEQLGGPVPFYLEPWVAVGILFAWAIVPVVVGYLQFRRIDL